MEPVLPQHAGTLTISLGIDVALHASLKRSRIVVRGGAGYRHLNVNVGLWPRLCENSSRKQRRRSQTSQIALYSIFSIRVRGRTPPKKLIFGVFTQPRPIPVEELPRFGALNPSLAV